MFSPHPSLAERPAFRMFPPHPSLAHLVRAYGVLEDVHTELKAEHRVSGNAKERFGLSAVLIRPDGIVAWASDAAPDRGELQEAADRWFVRSSGIEH